MTEERPFEDRIRRVMEANLLYYQALGRLTKEYWRAVFGMWREFPIRLASRPDGAPAAGRAPGIPLQPRDPTLVLEAHTGQEASGVFLVENRLRREVSTPVVASAFADRSGRQIHPTLRIVPGTVTLQPGARTLVQIVAVVSDELEPGVGYRGEVYVPELSEQGIPVLVRRRHDPPAKPTAEPAGKPSAKPTAKRKRRPGRRRSSES